LLLQAPDRHAAAHGEHEQTDGFCRAATLLWSLATGNLPKYLLIKKDQQPSRPQAVKIRLRSIVHHRRGLQSDGFNAG